MFVVCVGDLLDNDVICVGCLYFQIWTDGLRSYHCCKQTTMPVSLF